MITKDPISYKNDRIQIFTIFSFTVQSSTMLTNNSWKFPNEEDTVFLGRLVYAVKLLKFPFLALEQKEMQSRIMTTLTFLWEKTFE